MTADLRSSASIVEAGEFKSTISVLKSDSLLCVSPTGNIVLELSKDKHNASLLDRQLVQFQSSVNKVESELSAQIRYLTQVKHTTSLIEV